MNSSDTFKGKIEVICGSMFSGKTEELIKRLKKVELNGLKYIVFRPKLDSRNPENKIISHAKSEISASIVSSAEEILKLSKEYSVIGIDEAQFFDQSIVEVCNALANQGVRIIVAGLDMDFNNPEDAMAQIENNLPKIKFRLLLTGVILKEMAQDPDLQKVWGEFIDIFQNKYFQPFLIATLTTLKEYEPQIEAQGERVEKIVSKVINRTGDAASDAFGNVVAGIPYVGTVISGLGGLDNIAKMIIANVNGWGELFLETSYRLSVTLKKVSPQGLSALDGTIDMVLNAYNTYLAVKNTIDKWNAVSQGIKFNPDEGYSAEKLTQMMMQKAETSGTMPGTNPEVSSKTPDNPEEADKAKENTTKTPENPVSEVKPSPKPIPTVKKGGTRKNRRKKRTKKKSRKH